MSVTPSPARVREVLDLALERPPHERPAFVAGVCGSDARLRDEVVSLLGALDAGGELLEPPAAPAPEPVPPLTGLSFGNYRVAERVGEGGMGIVYRAEDTRLGRTVAVKALPPTLARDAHRRARFEHEARVLASLSHPNIAAIHGVEETARGPVLVLEFVPGQTLTRRLAAGRLPPDEAITIATHIARGLEAAHAAGVVHRDLKPSNIQLTPDGGVKILDFGVAKQVGAGASTEQTVAGSLIGTAAYMSPEQARGRPVDRRTDLWALGCVLFEMLTGDRVFEGETQSDTVAAVLRAAPDWSRLPVDLPESVRRVLGRCLEKDPEQRQRDAGDVVLELTCAEPPASAVRASRWPLALVAGVGLAGAGLVGGLLLRGSAPASAPAAPVRFQLNVAPEQAVFVTTGGPLALSADGRTLAWAAGDMARSRLVSRRIDSSEVLEMVGTEGAVEPCFSPDGRWIAFRSETQIRRVPASGGGTEVLVAAGVEASGLSWDESGLLYVGRDPSAPLTARGPDWGVQRLGPDGRRTQLTHFDLSKEITHLHPEPLPGGEAALFTCMLLRGEGHATRVEAVRVATGERRIVVTDAEAARFVPPNHLVYWQGGALVTAPFDLKELRLTDGPRVVVRPLMGGDFTAAPRFAVSRAGVLATLPGDIQYDFTRLAWYNLDGTWTQVAEGGAGIDAPRLSPDGQKVSMLMGRSGGDVWVQDLTRSTKSVLTRGDTHHHPVWTPDGKRLVFAKLLEGVRWQLQSVIADGSAPPEVLWEAPQGSWGYPTDFLPDGRVLLSMGVPGVELVDVYTFDPRTREPPRRLMPTRAYRYGARMSPDGTMIAYTSEETSRTEVYLHAFPSLEPKISVSSGIGYRPVWSGDGKKLFYRNLDQVLVVDVSADAAGRIGVSPARLVAEHLPDARYESDREGKRLLMGRPAGDLGRQTKIDLVVGWDPARP